MSSRSRFGTETDTLDAEGEVVATSDRRPTLAEVEAVLPRFTGAIEQVPPAYSALKVDGKRAYDLRAGGRGGGAEEPAGDGPFARALVMPREARESSLRRPATRQLDPLSPARRSSWPTGHPRRPTSPRAPTSASLARDIAHALGTVGHVTMLRRTKAGPFTLEPAISLDKLDEIAKGAQP